MNQAENKRSGMLSTIYDMLPGIDNDYAAKLVYTLEDKKTLAQLQQDIADLAAQLNSDSPMTDTVIAKMLLDECTLPAALRQLRIYNNSTSITELCAALNVSAADTGLLLETYASFSSNLYFDEAFEQAVTQINSENQTDEAQARGALDVLLDRARNLQVHSAETAAQNRKDIFSLADQYHLSVKLTAQLEFLYSQPASILVKPAFEKLVADLLPRNPDQSLCASLAARVLLCQLTAQDAQDTAVASQLLNNQLLEEDLLVVACRYLKVKKPQDIADAFDGVLKKLPYAVSPAENLGLAVRVLLDGTPESFRAAAQAASLKRDRELLRRSLSKNPWYSGYEYELARHYGGKKNAAELDALLREQLQGMPYCVAPEDNQELACKVLLGTLSQEEAVKQAAYMRDLKAKTVTEGLAPGVLKNYLGTKPAEELINWLEQRLSAYTFWKDNRGKHIFALRMLVDELNGTLDRRITAFILDSLEEGCSGELAEDMLQTIVQKNPGPQELEELLEHYQRARVTAKTA